MYNRLKIRNIGNVNYRYKFPYLWFCSTDLKAEALKAELIIIWLQVRKKIKWIFYVIIFIKPFKFALHNPLQRRQTLQFKYSLVIINFIMYYLITKL